MSQVDRAAVDLPTEAVNLHNRLREFQPALERRVGELAITGATPDERLELGVMREHLEAVSELARAAVSTITEADIPLRASPESLLSSPKVYDVVRRFVDQQGGGFTVAHLKSHLRELDIELPNDSRAFQRQFADWQEQIMAEKTAAGERRRWVRLDDTRIHALAWLEAPQTKPTPAATGQSQPASLKPMKPSASAAPPVLPPATEEVSPRSVSKQPAGPSSNPQSARLVTPATLAEEAATNTAALRLVSEASGEPAKTLVGRLVKELNMSTPAAREVFERLVGSGQIHRHNGGGRVRYSIEPSESRPTAASTPAASESATVSEQSAEVLTQTAQQVLEAFIGRGLSFGTALSPQEIARKITESNSESSVTADDVKAAANYLWSLGFVTRIEARGKLKLQLADRAIMRAMKSEEGRHSVVTLLSSGLKFVPPQKPARRPPARKKR